jgi:hypothetical protein
VFASYVKLKRDFAFLLYIDQQPDLISVRRQSRHRHGHPRSHHSMAETSRVGDTRTVRETGPP